MISVLIPIYNQDVNALVTELHRQLRQETIDFEILCFDDASQQQWQPKNRSITKLEAVRYEELPQNLGRSKIRNALIEEAAYETLLCLDSDSKLISDSFIQTYVEALDNGQVINGGRSYPTQRPTSDDLMLHYTYGIKKESKTAAQRTIKPGLYFHTNNFLVSRDIARAYPFAESLSVHGYEDLAFATRLQRDGIAIHHIDNPVEHEDIISAKDFLVKMEESSYSLAQLYKQKEIMRTPMIKAYEFLSRTKTLGGFLKFYKYQQQAILKNLHSAKPSMRYLDVYKLYHFCVALNRTN